MHVSSHCIGNSYEMIFLQEHSDSFSEQTFCRSIRYMPLSFGRLYRKLLTQGRYRLYEIMDKS